MQRRPDVDGRVPMTPTRRRRPTTSIGELARTLPGAELDRAADRTTGIPTGVAVAGRAASRAELPEDEAAAALPHAVRPDRHRRARCASHRRRQPRQRLHRRLPPAVVSTATPTCASRSRCAASSRSVPTVTGLWPAAELVRARGVGHVRHRASTAIPTCAASSCRRGGRAIRCARSTRRAATEMGPFQHADASRPCSGRRTCAFQPEEWGMERAADDHDVMFLNLGPAPPRHPRRRSASSLQLRRRGDRRLRRPTSATTTAARRRWASARPGTRYIPYTDRVDYLGGVHEQPALRAGGRAARRHRGAGAGAGDPRDAGRAVPHHQPPGLATAPSPRTSGR